MTAETEPAPRILVVDDVAANVRLLEAILERNRRTGHASVCAGAISLWQRLCCSLPPRGSRP